MKTLKLSIFLFFCFFSILGFSQEEKSLPIIAVSIPPQAFIINRLAGDIVKVETLVPLGIAAETYAPKPSQLTHLATAKVYFKIGFSFEDALLPKITSTCKSLRIIDMRHNVKLIKMQNHAHNGIPCSCGNSPYDPHIWVSPKRMLDIAQTVALYLKELLPNSQEVIDKNLSSLLKDLKDLDLYIHQKLDPYQGSAFYIYHPGFGYFAQDYNLRQIALELNGKAPSAKQMTYFIQQARKENIKMIFVQRQFASDSVQALAKVINASILQVENLSEEYIKTTKDLADKIALSLEAQRK